MRITRQQALSVYTSAVSGAGAIALIVALWMSLRSGSFFGDHLWLLATFAILLTVAELRPMHYLVNGAEVTASWTFAFAMLFIAPPGACLVVMVVSTLIGEAKAEKPIAKAAFNVGQNILSLAAAVWVGSQLTNALILSSENTVDSTWLVAALTSFVVAFAVNILLISVAIALSQNLPFTQIIRLLVDGNLAMDGLLLTLAPVFAVIGIEAPLLIPLVLVTTITIYRSASIAMSNRHEATHDALTGLSNRRLFEEHASMLLTGAKSGQRKVGIILIDLDGFKGINDRLGHHYGDIVLKVIAERLLLNRLPTDIVSRLGGDEFAIAIGELTGAKQAISLAEEILEEIEKAIDIEGMPLAVSASLGVSLFPSHGDELQVLLHNADTAMYEAKSSSRGVHLFSAMHQSGGPHRLQLISDMAEAIGTDQLSMHYQPRFDLRTGHISSVEALLRWDHPIHGKLSPAWFMPQTEQTELMRPLTESVLDMSLAAVKQWHERGLEIRVAVNVSARNLHDLRFPGQVAAILTHHDFDARFLEIEITENTVMADPSRSATVLAELRELGVQIAIDDFGTGYSSLSILRSLRVDCIKIDRSFITNLDTQPDDLVIVRSIIDLARNLGLGTVAEGVETGQVFDIIRNIGCDAYQGYLGSPPVDEQETLALLLANAEGTSERWSEAA